MKLPRIRRPALPDVDDLHIYGGLLLLAAGGALVAPALGLAVLGTGLIALGFLYSLASARQAKAGKSARPRPFDVEALMTAAVDDEAVA